MADIASAIIRELRKRLQKLEAESERITREKEAIQTTLGIFEREQGEATEEGSDQPLGNLMHEVMTAAGAPLHYRDIYRRLVDRGIHVPGKDPARNVGAHLSLDTRFKSLGNGKWGLKSWESQTAGQHAGTCLARTPVEHQSLEPELRLHVMSAGQDAISKMTHYR